MSLEAEIKKLTAAIEALTARIGAIESPTVDVPTVDVPTVDVPTVDVPTVDAPSTTITADELTRVCLALSRAGKKDDIKAKLSELGAARVGELTGNDYDVFAEWAVAQ